MNDKIYNTALFDAYLSGELTGTEKQSFDDKLRNDSVFLTAFEEHKDFIKGIRYAQEKKIRNSLNEVKNELAAASFFDNNNQNLESHSEKKTGRVIGFRRILAYAASSLILIGLGYFYITESSFETPKDLFAEFYQPEKTVLPEILDRLEAEGFGKETTEENIHLSNALEKYETGDFTEARTELNNFLTTSPGNKIANFYLGLTLLEIGEIQPAAARLASLANDVNFDFQDEAKWYSALAYEKFDSPEGKANVRRLMEEIAKNEASDFSEKALQYLKSAQ